MPKETFEFSTWPKQKIVRGIKHLQEITQIIDSWNAEENVWVQHRHGDSPKIVLSEISLEKEPPTSYLSLCLGDALHNFRSGLDQFAWELCHFQGQKPAAPKNVYFPITVEKKLWREKVANLKTIPIEFLDRIEKSQPFHFPDQISPLQLMSDLSNQDKHREIICATAVAQTFELDFAPLGNIEKASEKENDLRIDFIEGGNLLVDGGLYMRTESRVPLQINTLRNRIAIGYFVKYQGIEIPIENVIGGLSSISALIDFIKWGEPS